MYIIGIDAGGTKTFGSIISKSGDLLVERISGQGNVSVDYESALRHIKDSIDACLQTTWGESCIGIVAGIAGVGQGELKEQIKAHLEEYYSLPVHVLTDVELAYYAYHGNEDGILAIAGTGSVCMGKQGSDFSWTGGWGHLLGDEGSSYDIGKHTLKQLATEIEQGGPLSEFSSFISRTYGIRSRNELIKFVYSNEKDKIASLTVAVAKLASDGNDIANTLLQQAAESLTLQTLCLIKRMGITGGFSIVCTGSLFVKNNLIQSLYKENIKKHDVNISVCISKTNVVTGAWAVWENAREEGI
ncbi:N-acetylglucosamine kinase [Virgibacillus halodenitrificans]|uniref:N-acetylglucosamine kinase n=1 Tax=Virgibacillus halodenitrificans TaxID=1482 RepID=UPI000EF46BFD|nr:BadF/BadG/BcrA/BcrD ATPase family protein [Virgibacillus halodenitrificans]